MRQVLSGNGVDTTSTVEAALQANNLLWVAHLYLIGEPEDDFAIWLTDWPAPLSYPLWGNFNPGVISRTKISSKFGLAVDKTKITWSPGNLNFTTNTSTASPLHLAQFGFYDNWSVRIWRTIMPTPGDANTWGAFESFKGMVCNTSIDRGKIQFDVNSLMMMFDEDVPTNVIEQTSTLAPYTGASPPAGLSVIPKFNVIAGSTPNKLILDCTYPTAHQIFSNELFYQGFVAFNNTGTTLEGAWSPILANGLITILGVNYNVVYPYLSLPWAPTAGVDTCIISGKSPITSADGDFQGFIYVPQPQLGLGVGG